MKKNPYLLLLLASCSLAAQTLFAQEALPYGQAVAAPIEKSGLTVELELFAEIPPSSDSIPKTRINGMTALRDGSGRLFVNDLRGKLYKVDGGTPRLYMDYAELVPALYHESGLGSGLGSVAFHPDFATNGMLYTTHVERFDPSSTDEEIPSRELGNWTTGVVSEWTTDDPHAGSFNGTRREMLRVALPTNVHGLQEIAFNPNAQKDEADYGMLYICVGEAGSMQMGRNHKLRNLESPLGCILRIDPMGTGSSIGDYGIPADNPWADHEDPNVLGEIWCMGMRNPHRISWDTEGSGRMLFVDIGEMRVEEINIGEPGRDYGWPVREGTFRFDSLAGRHLVFPVSDEELANEPDFTYPVAQYDHTQGYAISGGGVYRGKALPQLLGKYVFGDIVSGRLFYVDEDALEFGSLAPLKEFFISMNGSITSMAGTLNGGRVDLRLGWDAEGELYISEKTNGKIYKAVGAGFVENEEAISMKNLDRQLIEHEEMPDPEFAVVAAIGNPMIDNMEDGDLRIINANGRSGEWLDVNAQTDGINGLRVLEMEGPPGGGKYVLNIHIAGAGGQGSKVLLPVVGKAGVDSLSYYDSAIYDGIQFWVKGSRESLARFQINTVYTIPVSRGGMCDGEDYECDNGYTCRFKIREEWTKVRIPFSRFEQSGYPNDGPLDPGIIKELGLSFRSRSESDFWIDDISFY